MNQASGLNRTKISLPEISMISKNKSPAHLGEQVP